MYVQYKQYTLKMILLQGKHILYSTFYFCIRYVALATTVSYKPFLAYFTISTGTFILARMVVELYGNFIA